MAREEKGIYSLKNLFLGLEMEEAYESGNLHKVGRILRSNRFFLHEPSKKLIRNFDPYKKSAMRNLSRRSTMAWRDREKEDKE
ncbi:hypothetical protein AKJ39_00115 [candidate division MSBL1 archaeon SCGC-AAA259J03]|uniref:Uncharacterized protein n=1 Tax=candidate division MSBL1 archaeon SCGC-AAA259J03 TaxID=1698269 RepID=A0A656YXK4_9EURY|nr:hypothetical protein AKJ39_00115 [candidate division MSBL1 archaeon SCGC-AAA259J03]